MKRHSARLLLLGIAVLISCAGASDKTRQGAPLIEKLLDNLAAAGDNLASKPLLAKDLSNKLLKDVELSSKGNSSEESGSGNEDGVLTGPSGNSSDSNSSRSNSTHSPTHSHSPTPAPKPALESSTHIDGCPVPSLPLDFVVEDKWWQWTFSKEVLGMDGKTKLGTIKASMFGIPTKLSFYDKDDQLVAMVKWHFISFVGAHDFQDCKGKKLAESDEKLASRLFGNKHFSQYELKTPNGEIIAESSKTKFFNHQINLVDPKSGRSLLKIDKNFMSFSNKWHVHSYVNDTTKYFVADPRLITLVAASQEGVPFMGWGSLTIIMIVLLGVSCICCCFGGCYYKHKIRR